MDRVINVFWIWLIDMMLVGSINYLKISKNAFHTDHGMNALFMMNMFNF